MKLLRSSFKISSKLSSKLKPKNCPDDFIAKYNQNNKNKVNTLIDIKSLDIKRKVFVSLIGLYQTWKRCPPFILFSAIFILPLKRKYIYSPAKHINEFQCIFSDVSRQENQTFIKMLQWKDSQGLIMWMSDDSESTENISYPGINPFWYDLSKKLSSLYDPITGRKYNKLNLDPKWWEAFPCERKYDVKTSSVLAELFSLTMKFKTISAIVYQSNPSSLHPICYYENCNISKPVHVYNKSCAFDVNKDSGGWYVSTEYDL